MFGDVHASKNVLRWRTALVLRELEDEINAVENFRPIEQKLQALMLAKETIEQRICQVRVELQRLKEGYGALPPDPTEIKSLTEQLQARHQQLRDELDTLDIRIAPLARQGTELSNPSWGLLMRAGNDKSYLAFQIERYADIYTSRVSNFLAATPFAYLRSPRGSLPHDQNPSQSALPMGTLEDECTTKV